MRVGRCYKCGSANAQPVSEDLGHVWRVYVSCSVCPQTGPTIEDKDEASALAFAVELWNWRSDRRRGTT